MWHAEIEDWADEMYGKFADLRDKVNQERGAKMTKGAPGLTGEQWKGIEKRYKYYFAQTLRLKKLIEWGATEEEISKDREALSNRMHGVRALVCDLTGEKK